MPPECISSSSANIPNHPALVQVVDVVVPFTSFRLMRLEARFQRVSSLNFTVLKARFLPPLLHLRHLCLQKYQVILIVIKLNKKS